MGAGKSLIGHALAQRLQLPFFDLDRQIEIMHGCSVSDFFQIHGEQEFRKEETLILKETAKSNESFVIASGGGTPCFYGNMAWMNDHGITVYLNILPETLAKRLKRDRRNRPLIASLSDKELTLFVKKTLHEREEFYRMSHIEITPENYSPQGLIDHLANRILGV
jgi:shikimate kinase